MMKSDPIYSALTAQLSPAHLTYVAALATTFHRHENLPTWLRSIETYRPETRREMLLRAAHVFDTAVPDSLAVETLTTLAEKPALFTDVVAVLRSTAALSELA